MTRILNLLLALAFVGCTAGGTIVERELLTTNAPGQAYPKAVTATQQVGVTIHSQDRTAGTISGEIPKVGSLNVAIVPQATGSKITVHTQVFPGPGVTGSFTLADEWLHAYEVQP